MDFNSQLPAVEVKKILSDTVGELGSFGVKAEFRRAKIFRENGERGITGDISYEGPLFIGKSASKGKVKIDVSLRGEKAETGRVVITPRYDDISQFILTVLTLDEIFAEKMRALVVRSKPRDLYDVWVLLGKGVGVDYSLINEKLELYNKVFGFKEFVASVAKAEKGWESDLKELLPQLESFEKVKEVVVVEIFPIFKFTHDALEGIEFLKKKANFEKLIHRDKLVEVEKSFKDFLRENDPEILGRVLRIYTDTGELVLGDRGTYETTIWDADVHVRGKATTLGYIMDDLRDEVGRMRSSGME